MLFLCWWKQVLRTGLQDGKWSCIFMGLFCNCRIMSNKDPLQLHQYFIPFGCWWPQGFPYHVKLCEMEFFTLYSRWNFPFLLLSILLAYFRNDFSGFIPNIAAMTQPLFLVLNSEMHLLLLHSLCLCIFPSKFLIWFPCFPPGASFSLHGSPIDLRIFRVVTIFYKWAAAEEFSTGDRTRVECF